MARKNRKSARKVAYGIEIEKAKAQIAVQKTKMMKVKAAPKDGGDTAMGSSGKLKKFKGIKLKRNKTVRGIKIKDSASRKKVAALLAAEKSMSNMLVSDSLKKKKKK
ncbi:hypothetical protein H632_c3492p0 [Helicosporidium sp. ATCC 50920]|nr:hypothetical protein H632_c3492p0 [Helicosporidium sp. ATCC 50920]|eukprot:KDD72340.1 hypothetical protein H632_c3492p0 [Helicosporidium sp. ATCC 50920]